MIQFIINPHSRSGKGRKIWESIEKELIRYKIPYNASLTEYPGHAAELAHELTSGQKKTPLLGVMGGDGSINEVINGLNTQNKPVLFYIPTGSGNDFSRGMKSSITGSSIAEYLSDIQNRHYTTIDLGSASVKGMPPRRFAVSSGIGFDAQICHEINTGSLKKVMNHLHLGKIAYLMIGLKTLLTCPKTSGKLTIRRQGHKTEMNLENIILACAHNLPYEGGGILFAPKAAPDDGLLDVCVITIRHRIDLLPLLIGVISGGNHIHMKGVHYFKCDSASLELSEPRQIHMDGETPCCTDNILWEILPSQIRVIT